MQEYKVPTLQNHPLARRNAFVTSCFTRGMMLPSLGPTSGVILSSEVLCSMSCIAAPAATVLRGCGAVLACASGRVGGFILVVRRREREREDGGAGAVAVAARLVAVLGIAAGVVVMVDNEEEDTARAGVRAIEPSCAATPVRGLAL